MSMWRWILRPICWMRGHAEPTTLFIEGLPLGWWACGRCWKDASHGEHP